MSWNNLQTPIIKIQNFVKYVNIKFLGDKNLKEIFLLTGKPEVAVFKYKGKYHSIYSIYVRDYRHIFIDGNLALRFNNTTIEISEAVHKNAKYAKEILISILDRIKTYYYVLFEPEITWVETLKDKGILLNIPIEWEQTRKLKMPKRQSMTESNSDQN